MHKTPLVLLMAFSLFAAASAEQQTTFSNPFYQGEDPWVIFKDGFYYVCTSGPLDPTAVYVSKSASLLERGEKVKVWEDAANYHRVFAPELHFVEGKWYIYFCGDVNSLGWKHMAVVLQANTDDPLDGFTNKGVLFTGDSHGNGQANDFTVVTFNNQLYAFWGSLSDPYVSGAVMAPMDNPTTITAYRKEIGLDAEGPRAIVRNNKLIMTGSWGAFASKSYRLVALMYTPSAGAIDNKASWKPLDTLLKTTTDVWGPARASFTVSADGAEFWTMYHSKIWSADDNGMRMVNIKKFTFKSDDTPDFGTTIPGPAVIQANPSGDPGRGEVYQAETAALTGGAVVAATNRNYTGTGYVDGFTKQGVQAAFTVTVPAEGDYRATLRYANGVVVAAEQQTNPTVYPSGRGSLTLYLNGVKFKRTYLHRTTNWNVWMLQGETLPLNAGNNTISYRFDAGDTGLVTLDFLAVGPSANPLHGLTGSYYDNLDLTGLKLTRIDPELSFDWGAGSPDALIAADSFSVRWQGFIQPLFTETYTFYSKSDNGRKLWINNQLVIDKWLFNWDSTYTGTIALEAGKKYSITYEYFDATGGANTRLEWSSARQLRETVPSQRLFVSNSPSVAVKNDRGAGLAAANPGFRVARSGSLVRIDLTAPYTGVATIEITSLAGKILMSEKCAIVKGVNRVNIPGANLAAGGYVLKYCISSKTAGTAAGSVPVILE